VATFALATKPLEHREPIPVAGHGVASGALRYVNTAHGTRRPRRMFTDDFDACIEAQTRKNVPCPCRA
jgi:hypothetical protein